MPETDLARGLVIGDVFKLGDTSVPTSRQSLETSLRILVGQIIATYDANPRAKEWRALRAHGVKHGLRIDIAIRPVQPPKEPADGPHQAATPDHPPAAGDAESPGAEAS